ncbi:MAG TPA: glycoside hydrolase family 32 protein [Mucilaginibacter sp.]|jgi:fructan beta-fructosidase|nr:glycoside hydrolase family 32 protein [Mucilaginibacter sp.]
MNKLFPLAFVLLTGMAALGQSKNTQPYHEPFRPQIHFSPKEHWMNDPNGMVYFNHTYHLFFQYYPGGTVWGPMHWGHAISRDLVHWKQLPIALYPDSLGYIFSGSAVVDSNNTSGFGKNGKIPLVAIFTHHDPKGADAGKNNFQNQSLAYSLDGGYTWTKYAGNPVLKNPGITDFRDPKVSWYKPGKKWVMTLATKDRITFYSSLNLKNWTKESEFGQTLGAHGGVWECPDLFPLKLNSKTHWVLIVNLNPGGPNKGSATQYFVGQFDGHTFTTTDTTTKWLDYGPDEYAGVTWNNTGNRRIFLGWMSNWLYGTKVPTTTWRSAFTIPRELNLTTYNGRILLKSLPVNEFSSLKINNLSFKNIDLKKGRDFTGLTGKVSGQYLIKLETASVDDFKLTLGNSKNEKLIIGYDKKANQYYIDRSHSGIVDFNKDFAAVATAPRMSAAKTIKLTLLVDRASVELFADDGATVMTCIFFPNEAIDKIALGSDRLLKVKSLSCFKLKSIW